MKQNFLEATIEEIPKVLVTIRLLALQQQREINKMNDQIEFGGISIWEAMHKTWNLSSLQSLFLKTIFNF